MVEHDSQHGSSGGGVGKNKKEDGEGFMAIYHDVEEIFYGPDSGLDSKARVLFCIRHKLLRDGLCEKHIGTVFISQKTGLNKNQIKAALKSLLKTGLIICHQNKSELIPGKLVYGENSYCLNPEKFKDLYNWYKNNPTVRVYESGKLASYSKLGIAPNETLPRVSATTPPRVSATTPPGPPIDTGTDPNSLDLMRNLFSNNPSSNNPKYKEPVLREISESFTLSKGPGTGPEHEARVRAQLAVLEEEKRKAAL